jgi:hypothetical protein
MGAGVPALICNFFRQETPTDAPAEIDSYPLYTHRWRVYAYRLSKPILNQRLVCLLGYPREYFMRYRQNRNPNSPSPVIWEELPLLYNSIDKLLVFIIISLLPAYLFARVYLVVESFIQLFHLEPGPAFEQPHWSAYIPHLG